MEIAPSWDSLNSVSELPLPGTPSILDGNCPLLGILEVYMEHL
jgi:hypothetical protein